MVISQSILFEAKAFLCWDKFSDLSIKLIPIEKAIAFFHPPFKDRATINLFYEIGTKDYSPVLCLLFHEAGHFRQWQKFSSQNRADDFETWTDIDKGEQKVQFEREAWTLGEELLNEFLIKINMDQNNLKDYYNCYAEQSYLTYK